MRATTPDELCDLGISAQIPSISESRFPACKMEETVTGFFHHECFDLIVLFFFIEV